MNTDRCSRQGRLYRWAGWLRITDELPTLNDRYQRLVNLFTEHGVADIEGFAQQTITDPKHTYDILEQAVELLADIKDLLEEVAVVDFDSACAEQFGKLQGGLLQQGISVPTADLMIAAVALVHNLTLVTNNTADSWPSDQPRMKIDYVPMFRVSIDARPAMPIFLFAIVGAVVGLSHGLSPSASLPRIALRKPPALP